MSRVLALVEGPTERAVLEKVVAPYLARRDVYLYPRVIGKPGHKGGIKRGFQAVQRELRALAGQEPDSVITTFFDYYALPLKWPGVAESKGRPANLVPGIVETAIREFALSEIAELASRPSRFVPYIQMFELEALLFAGPAEMAGVFGLPDLRREFERIVEACGGCEEINDHPETAPSKRIEQAYPAYRKGRSSLSQAPIIAGRIGLETIRDACPHFNDWVERMESLKAGS